MKTDEPENAIVPLLQEHHYHALRLVPGEWRNIYSEQQYCTVVAECLNKCVYHDGLVLYGYLITGTGILLITAHKETEQKLRAFYDYIKQAVYKQLHPHNERTKDNTVAFYHLFRKYRLTDGNLVKLLLGCPVALPYHDAGLERLQYQLQREPYCSVIDYPGAVGPVIIYKIAHGTEIYCIEAEIEISDHYLFE